MSLIRCVSLVVIVSLSVAGCANRVDDEPGFVQRQWTEQLQELGIYPTYPPREQVYVGDVYLFPYSPRSAQEIQEQFAEQLLTYSRFVGTVPISGGTDDSIVAQFLQSRPDFPASTDGLAGPAGNNPEDAKPREQPVSNSGNIFTRPNPGERLGMAGFPGFFSITYDQFDFGLFAPLQQVSVALGISQANTDRVTVSVPFAESYGVPMPLIWPLVVREDNRLNPQIFGEELAARIEPEMERRPICWPGDDYPDPTASNLLPMPLLPTFAAGQPELWSTELRPMSAYFAILTEVYYARSIDVTTRATEAFAADLRAALAAPTSFTIIPISDAPTTDSAEAVQVEDGDSAVITENSIILNRARETVNSLGSDRPGLVTNVVAISAAGVTLQQTFARPVAIGWRGFVIEVDLTTLCVKNIPVSSTGPYQALEFRRTISEDRPPTAVSEPVAPTNTVLETPSEQTEPAVIGDQTGQPVAGTGTVLEPLQCPIDGEISFFSVPIPLNDEYTVTDVGSGFSSEYRYSELDERQQTFCDCAPRGPTYVWACDPVLRIELVRSN